MFQDMVNSFGNYQFPTAPDAPTPPTAPEPPTVSHPPYGNAYGHNKSKSKGKGRKSKSKGKKSPSPQKCWEEWDRDAYNDYMREVRAELGYRS